MERYKRPEDVSKLEATPPISVTVRKSNGRDKSHTYAAMETPSLEFNLHFVDSPDGTITAFAFLRPSSQEEAEEKKPGEVTALYAKVHELLQQKADSMRKVVRYTLGTRNVKLALWALHAGREIFQCDDIYLTPDHKQKIPWTPDREQNLETYLEREGFFNASKEFRPSPDAQPRSWKFKNIFRR
jgi:hypothetical protein